LSDLAHLNERLSAAPGLSPGIVEDDELLLREMFNPEHVRDGKVIERAVSVDDLRIRGFSVHRMKHVNPAMIKAAIAIRLAKPRSGSRWYDEGVARLAAGVPLLQERMSVDDAYANVDV
jgi:hypothetical protein